MAAGAAAWRASIRLRPLLSGRPSLRKDVPVRRAGFLLREIGLHRRLLRFRLSGIIHAAILVAFVILLSGILQAYSKAFFPDFRGWDAIAVVQDLAAILMLSAIGLALYNRLVLRPARFKGSNKRDALVILGMISLIVLTMELEFAFHIIADGQNSPYRPVAGLLATGLTPLMPSVSAAQIAEQVFYWAHIASILGFLVYLPGSKHFHMVVGFPNVYLRSREPRGRLPTSGAEPAPPTRITELPWKGMLDLYSCTECGRCQSVCPAYAAGLPLSPKTLIMDLRNNLVDTALGTPAAATIPLAGGVISAETLWACTTCMACMQECPLHIEHVPRIVDMRRALVDEGEMSPLLQATLVNFQKYGNSFKKPARQRPAWTKELPFQVPDARDEPVEYLWYVGDYASFHPLVAERTRNVAKLLHQAGVSFGILYDREKNSGNDVRRIGEEGLFQDLAEENIAAINECDAQRIFTTDPHTLNTLVNEYPALGLRKDVVHHTQLLHELMRDGRLRFRPTGTGQRVTYHDPCYLGRYNGRYDAPRAIIRDLGFDLHDMPRCREKSFCCGAGGGRIFMEDESTLERPSENRIREALALGDISLFVVACPKDIVMYTAAIENINASDKIKVKEISDLFAVV
ncbi:(Fe-S)-binding protein [Borborobacter arsenicus]|uniref:(Fe-S)-binding protein n=1 Tax=Borborobacter arsenicus TaxID=1851146 RepID=UPI000FFB80AA|nr:(Fe-S)-binding protein [Pseudaminobacter arsenicus]